MNKFEKAPVERRNSSVHKDKKYHLKMKISTLFVM